MKVNYEWLQTFFDEGALPSPDELAELLIFHAYEVEGIERVGDMTVLDIDVLPNRAADSLSHRGIAREASTLLDVSMKRDPLSEVPELKPETDSVEVSLGTDASCTYYIAAHITGVTVQESPDWLKQRLAAIGQKSINNVVDATNYILFELGRPTHVFDADKLAGDTPHITTRVSNTGEHITLLGGEDVAVPEGVTLIVDGNSDTPLAVGGVKGGTAAEVDATTTNLIVEIANFNPTQTRLNAQALKLRTDASARFENNIADGLADVGAVELVRLIQEIAEGELRGYAVAGKKDAAQTTVSVSTEHASKLLGISIDNKTMAAILTRLGFAFEEVDGVFSVTAPFERRDVHIPEDVIEEVGRVYGYNKIESKQLSAPEQQPHVNKKLAYAERIRNVLQRAGCAEVYLYSLRDSGEVALKNSLASDKDHLRSDLSSGIREALDRNEKQMPLLGLYDAVRLFEVGNVFTKGAETTHVCVGVRVAGAKKREARTEEHMTKIRTLLEEELGTTLPKEQGETFEFDLSALLEKLPDVDGYPTVDTVRSDTAYSAVSQYPFVLRDIAVWVPEEVSSSHIQAIVEKHAGDLLKRNDVFDEFAKDGRVSYAFHLVFQSMNETLNDTKVGDIMAAIESEIDAQEGWEVR